MQLAGSLTVASIHSVRGQSEASGPGGPSAPKQSNFGHSLETEESKEAIIDGCVKYIQSTSLGNE